ncbi:hypothetical protein GCM10007164_11080 [Luteimonas padinae]|uniref:Uncharacterized protein n=1 Tax=Luteimonas padinae TaxID=1714359 RepID=A0ABV6SSY0_9GAMM|nr:hypothetical protein [Luteimonas padinae]GHD68862.1 hypothetical protein GCM10007164_11080 [Luteimonas padinae]
MKSLAVRAAPIIGTLVICLIGRMAVRGIWRLRQSVMEIDANLSEVQRLRKMPCLPSDEVVAERARAEISDWDMSALAESLELKPNY